MRHMSDTAIHRSAARSAGLLLRCSKKQHAEIVKKAQDQGLTVQRYLHDIVFGSPGDPLPPGRCPKATGQQELPISA